MKTQVFARRKRVARRRKAYSYRIPMQIRLYMKHWFGDAYPICPRCDSSLDRDFIAYCYRCGQKLGWDRINEVCFIKAGDKERKIHGKRRAYLEVTRAKDTERLYIVIPRVERRRLCRVPGRNRVDTEDTQTEQLLQKCGSTECASELSLTK